MSIFERMSKSAPYRWLTARPWVADALIVLLLAGYLAVLLNGWNRGPLWLLALALLFAIYFVLGSLLRKYPWSDRAFVWHHNVLLWCPAFLLMVFSWEAGLLSDAMPTVVISGFGMWVVALVIFYVVVWPSISPGSEAKK